MKDDAVSLPDAHPTIINVIGFRTATIEFQDQEILAFFQVFDRCGLDIITAIIELICIMTQLVKYFMQVLIDLFMQIGKMSSPVMISRIREVKDLSLRDNTVKTVTMTMLHLGHTEFRT